MADLSKLTVLVVDDNYHMIGIVSAILRGFDIGQIFTAKDGASALEIIHTAEIDVVITDYRMDFVDGEELVRLIRNCDDSTNRFVPTIMLTGYSEMAKIVAARDAGVDEFVCKPVTAKQIYEKLVAVVNSPRMYVKSETYFGPDRRRQQKELYGKPDRRQAA